MLSALLAWGLSFGSHQCYQTAISRQSFRAYWNSVSPAKAFAWLACECLHRAGRRIGPSGYPGDKLKNAELSLEREGWASRKNNVPFRRGHTDVCQLSLLAGSFRRNRVILPLQIRNSQSLGLTKKSASQKVLLTCATHGTKLYSPLRARLDIHREVP